MWGGDERSGNGQGGEEKIESGDRGFAHESGPYCEGNSMNSDYRLPTPTLVTLGSVSYPTLSSCFADGKPS